MIVLLSLTHQAVSVERGFVYCPAYPCSCESRDGALIVNCMSLYLTTLPKFLSFDGRIKELSLRMNSIRHLPAKGFRGLHIEKLDLLDNSITTVHDDAFVGLENSLKALSLQLYAFEGLPTSALSRLTRLRSLHIVGCKQQELHSEQFKNLESLESLQLIGCRISRLMPGVFGPLPKLRSLVLSGNGLRVEDVHEVNVLNHLTHLDLSSNDIRWLDNRIFARLSKLRSLNLANNEMSNIAAEAFSNLDFTLEELSLHSNQLNEEALKSLRYMKTMRTLDLHSNNISMLSEQDFSATRHLTSLNLAYNGIMSLERKSLLGLGASLVNLDLQGNPLETIEAGAFLDFQKLESLNVSRTMIGGSLRGDTFQGIEKTLRRLQASHCSIESPDMASLSAFSHMTQVDLSFNNVDRVDFETISGWRHVVFANFSHNNISEFLAGPLTSVNSTVKAFDISWNRIQVIPECVFFLLTELTDVKLDGNPLACNCTSSWLFRWRQLTHSNIREWSNGWQCAPSTSAARKMFSDLEFSDLKCGSSPSEEMRCLTQYLPWATVNPSPRSSEHVAASTPSSPPTSDRIARFNITHPNPVSLHVRWGARVGGLIGGYKVMLTRCNDSFVVESVTVSPDTTHYTFYPFDRNVPQEVCVVMLAEDLAHLETRCEGVSTSSSSPPVISIRDPKSKDQHLYTVVHNSFVPLLLIYISGSLALAFIIACLVLCVRKNRSKPVRVDPFNPGYPAWMDQRSSVTNLSVGPDHHMFLFEDLGAQEHRDYHTHSTLISGRSSASGRRLYQQSARDLPNVQLNRRNSRTPSVPSIVHLCPYECASLTSTLPKPLASEILAGRAEISDEFYFHF
ncbi:hypothetical protein Btru_066815 [Bulinus truncatus]|nr:hypothetical protein Btru_066815 [Bulinus truncatus]